MNQSFDFMNNPFLLLPIETKVREFHAKLLLGCFAAEAGFNVILGDQDEIQRHLRYLPRGIYLDKSVARTKTRSFRKNRKLGNRVVAWCEEGLVFLDPKSYLKERISVDAYKLVDIFFAWGNVQAKVIKSEVNEAGHKIICTGNPRFDLLRHPYRAIFSSEADKIRTDYGPFILINTNFSLYNHFYGRDFVISTMKEQGRLRNEEDEAFMVKWADYLGEMYQHFIAMIRHLSLSFPQYIIVIRPHPSENQKTWKNETKMLPNVRIVHEGNVIPWIMASEVMVHNGCTTGVEAYMLGEPVLCYCPITSEIFDSELPNAVSRKASSLDELAVLVREVLENPSGDIHRAGGNTRSNDLVDAYITGANGPMACENIVSALSGLTDRISPLRSKKLGSSAQIIRKKLEDRAILAKRILRRIIKGRTGGYAYLRQKFPGLKLEEVQQFTDCFKEVRNSFGCIKIREVSGSKSCFLIFRDKK